MQKLESIIDQNEIFMKFSPRINYIEIYDGLNYYSINMKPKSLKKLLIESKDIRLDCFYSKQIGKCNTFNDLEYIFISYHNQLYICLLLHGLELTKNTRIYLSHKDYGYLVYNFKNQSFEVFGNEIPLEENHDPDELVLFY